MKGKPGTENRAAEKPSLPKRRGHRVHYFAQFSIPCLILRLIQLQVDLPLVDGSYKWADGKSVGVYDSTVVAIHTDHPDGIVG